MLSFPAIPKVKPKDRARINPIFEDAKRIVNSIAKTAIILIGEIPCTVSRDRLIKIMESEMIMQVKSETGKAFSRNRLKPALSALKKKNAPPAPRIPSPIVKAYSAKTALFFMLTTIPVAVKDINEITIGIIGLFLPSARIIASVPSAAIRMAMPYLAN